MKRRASYLVLIVLLSLLLTSCWDRKELKQLAIVSAIGVDIDPDGGKRGIFQIINPQNVAGGLQGGNVGLEATPVSVYFSEGNNLTEMSRRVTRDVARDLYFAHTNLVVISEQFAREEGLISLMESLDRDVEFRTSTKIVIARDTTASDLMQAFTPFEKIPANHLIESLNSSEKKLGAQLSVTVKELIEKISSAGEEPVVTGFMLLGNKSEARKQDAIDQAAPKGLLHADNIGMFKNGKLVGWLSEEEAIGTLWILDKVQETYVNVDWEEKKNAIAYGVIRQKTKVNVRIKGEKPTIHIRIKAKGDISEVDVPIQLTDPGVIDKIEILVEEKIEKQVKGAIERAQKSQTDIFGFGEIIKRSERSTWNELKQNWNDIHFPELKVEIQVEASVRNTGLRKNPYFNEIREDH